MNLDKATEDESRKEGYAQYAKFMACITAHYLDSKAEYDPMSIFLSSKIDLVPYQIYDFSRLIAEERRSGGIRALIAYETGLGKTILVGMLIRELLSRATSPPLVPRVRRVLIVTPPTVLPQFRDEMARKFGLDFEEPAQGPPFLGDMSIASMDTLKMAEWMERLTEQEWDLVVVDEYHRVNDQNMRGGLVSLLTKKTKHFIALTATPHDGKQERYNFRLKTIAPNPLIVCV